MTNQVKLDLSYFFRGFENKSKSVKTVIEQAKTHKEMTHAEQLAGDLFNCLYQKNPRLRSVEDPNNLYSQAVRGVLKSGQFLKLRSQTEGSLAWSAVGASLLVNELAAQLDFKEEDEPVVCKFPTQPKDDGEKQEQESKIDEKEDNNSGDGDSETDSDSNDGENNTGRGSGNEPDNESDQNDSDKEPGDGESESDPSDDNGNSSDDSDNGDKDSEENGDDSDQSSGDGEEDNPDEPLDEQINEPVNKKVQEAVNGAGQKLDELIGGLRPGTGNSLETFNDSINLAETYTRLATNPRLAELIQLVGKLRLNTTFLAAMAIGEPEEVANVEMGNDLRKTLPQDLALAMGSDEELFLFMNKYNNNELIQYETKSHQRPGAGPMIVCIDDSGSMYGGRHAKSDWAKSLAIAIYIQAIKERRPFAAIPFSTSARIMFPAGMNTANPKYAVDPDFMEQLAGFMHGGGTNFDPAWRLAIEFMAKSRDGKQFRNADIVFITDGYGNLDKDQMAKDKEEYNVRLVTVFVGAGQGILNQYAGSEITQMAELSDAMTFVPNVSSKSEQEAFNIIRQKDLKGVRSV